MVLEGAKQISDPIEAPSVPICQTCATKTEIPIPTDLPCEVCTTRLEKGCEDCIARQSDSPLYLQLSHQHSKYTSLLLRTVDDKRRLTGEGDRVRAENAKVRRVLREAGINWDEIVNGKEERPGSGGLMGICLVDERESGCSSD